MTTDAWVHHPPDYRLPEVQRLLATLASGDCVSLIGLSGMGKSNLLGFLAYRAAHADPQAPACVLLDCNRLPALTPEAFFTQARAELAAQVQGDAIEPEAGLADPLEALYRAVDDVLIAQSKPLALLVDGFDPLATGLEALFFNNLRALRDAHKFRLTYLIATRRPLDRLLETKARREFLDLFAIHQVWLGPLAESDARWALRRLAERRGMYIDSGDQEALLRLSGRHPGLLKALASEWPVAGERTPAAWLERPGVRRECRLLWDDLPESAQNALRAGAAPAPVLEHAGLYVEERLFSPLFEAFVDSLAGHELDLDRDTGEVIRDGLRLPIRLTAKEHALLACLIEQRGAVCAKDDLIRAVWPEDRVFERGVRDDSLAQLVRRLRVKIEPDPSNPTFLLTVPGRGYRLLGAKTAEPPA